jgi:transposase-like protein
MKTDTSSPRALSEAAAYYSELDNALALMVRLRWPNGITCPHCESSEHSFISTRRMWKCKGCKKQFSVKVGTIFEDSPLGLDKWLTAIWLITNAKKGISSHELHRSIGITQKSAWFVVQRIRLAMKMGTVDKKLIDAITADETFIEVAEEKHQEQPRLQTIRNEMGMVVVMGM